MKFSFFKILIIFIVALFFIAASTIRSPNIQTNISFLYDQTDATLQQNIDQIACYLASFSGIDTVKGRWGAVSVNLSIIGETSTQEILTVYLAPSEPYWIRNEMEHRKRARQFFTDLKNALALVTKPGFGTKKSYINRTTQYHLTELAQKKGNRYCIIFSDLIENGPVISFYDFMDHPQFISEKRDSLIEVLSQDYSLTDLSGIEIVNIHNENLDFDELHEQGKRLFKTYWERKGATVDFKSSVPTNLIF